MYLLREGECVVEHTGKTTGTAVIGRLSSGDHFGEGAVMEGRDRRNCSVRCVSAAGCALGVLGKGAFEAILRAEPSLQSTFEQALERRNRQRLRSMVTLAAEQSDCTTREVKKGEVVFSQGEPAESFFLVDRGAVQMSYRTADGRQLPSKTHRAGDAFGASGLLVGMSSATRRDTAIALVDTTLKVIPHARFGTLMRQDSMLAEGLRRACSTAPTGGGGGGSGAGEGGAGRAPLRGQPPPSAARCWTIALAPDMMTDTPPQPGCRVAGARAAPPEASGCCPLVVFLCRRPAEESVVSRGTALATARSTMCCSCAVHRVYMFVVRTRPPPSAVALVGAKECAAGSATLTRRLV